ncbi:hypothetical protein [Dactylosporangium sp. CA-139066]|uniref:hypothetical protein n=1 Tax=Dactylosporangium sp. CA-139066 TaxID=3239930 RepID=UPI003D8C52D4
MVDTPASTTAENGPTVHVDEDTVTVGAPPGRIPDRVRSGPTPGIISAENACLVWRAL